MDDTSHTLKPWVMFAGCVLVIVVLYWAQAVLVPIALAVLLTFVLTPPVSWLERWLGRVPAVLAAVTLVFMVLGLAGWGLARQMDLSTQKAYRRLRGCRTLVHCRLMITPFCSSALAEAHASPLRDPAALEAPL